MERRWLVREERARQQAVSSRDVGRHRQVVAVVQADDHRRQPLGEVAQEARELGGQRDQEPGVDQVQEGLDHQRAEERHRQAMGQEGDSAATAASHRHLAHLSRLGETLCLSPIVERSGKILQLPTMENTNNTLLCFSLFLLYSSRI